MRRSGVLALLTAPAYPDLWHEDRRLIPGFARHDIEARAAVWSDPAVRWTDFDGVLIRSCWDYFLDYPAFIRLLDTLDAASIPVFNRSDVIRWNTDKRYLLDLEAAGAPVAPTEVLAAGTLDDVERLGADHDWTRIVVKPAISANGHDTHAVTLPLDPGPRAHLQRTMARGPVLIQPFVPEITAHGEQSLVFIDGSFSHAVLKRAGSGEFRVQAEHGGTAEPWRAPDWVIEQAAHALAAAARPTLYARVDGIVRDGLFVLMELELVEPNLYFEFAPDSAQRLADAVARELWNGSSHVRPRA